jgi:membrane-bound inhibitor of C-type lysozyme
MVRWQRESTATAPVGRGSRPQPGLVVLRRGTEMRVAFGVRAASGAKCQGDEVAFWEARNEATVTWSGAEMTCRRTT